MLNELQVLEMPQIEGEIIQANLRIANNAIDH